MASHSGFATPEAPAGPEPMTRAGVLSIWSRHLLALVFPLNALAFVLTGPHQGAIALLFLLPTFGALWLDWQAWPERRTPAANLPAWPFDLLLVVLSALQVANVVLLARMMSQQDWLSLDVLITVTTVGASSAYSGIVVAHELIHRPNAGMRQLGRLLLATVMYEHFYTEHVRGHHVRVGTPEDPATARFGESFGRFYLRTVPAQLRSAWRLETKRLGDIDMPLSDPRLLHSRVVHGIVFELGFAAALAIAFGPLALTMHLVQALWASRALEVVNYFEHWGLTRSGRKVESQHSWDTDSWFTYYALTGLSRHADHHAYASRPYEQLRTHDASPNLPRGYLALFPLVLGSNRRFQKLATAELRRLSLGPFAADATDAERLQAEPVG